MPDGALIEAGPAFELDRLEVVGDRRLEVTGRWYGVRGRRFVRPTLTLGGEERTRRLADLEDKPWAAEDGDAWRAAFSLEPLEEHVTEIELAVAPDIAVVLKAPPGLPRAPRPRQRRRPPAATATTTRTQTAPAAPAVAPKPAATTERAIERDALVEERDRAKAERDALRTELATARAALAAAQAEISTARDDADGAQSNLTRVRQEADEAIAAARQERDQAVAAARRTAAERDRAVAERDRTVAERDRAVTERDQAVSARDHAVAERERAAAERDQAFAAARDQVVAPTPAVHREPPRHLRGPRPPASSLRLGATASWMQRSIALGVVLLAVLALLIIIQSS